MALVQVIASTAALWLYASLTDDLSANELAHARATQILARAARAGGLQSIVPSPELAAYLEGRDRLRYGVAVSGRWLEGSTVTPDLGWSSGAAVQDSRLVVATPTESIEGHTTVTEVDGVPVLILTAGNAPDAADVAYAGWIVARQGALLLGPILAASLLITWWGLSRGVRPLADLAGAASRIDLDATDQRLDTGPVPVELKPLAEAFNLALERLSRSYAGRKRFLDDAAHELRTPLAIMRARVDSMPASEDRTLLQRDLRRLGALSDQLLASARLSSHRAPAPVPVDLAALLRDLVADYAPLAHDMGLSVAFSEAGESTKILGHPAALIAAFANVLNNALRAEPRGGCIEVRVEGGLRVSSQDHGPGVDPKVASLIFEPFWRGDEKRPGSGLGLAIVAEIVRHHGATIGVEQTNGGGATFVMTFPPLATSLAS